MYQVLFYISSSKGAEPVKNYIGGLSEKEAVKVTAHIQILSDKAPNLKEPYAKHIIGKLWELRVQTGKSKHRIFYVIVTNKKIILLHAFLKKTPKTPKKELDKALNNFDDFKINKHLYGL